MGEHSDALGARLRKIHDAHARREVLEILRTCPAVERAEFPAAPGFSVSPAEIWPFVVGIGAIPARRFNRHAPQLELEKWVVETLAPTIDKGCCLVSLGGFGQLPWIAVRFLNADEGLRQIWNRMVSKDIICASNSTEVMRAIIEEEYEYLGFEVSGFAPQRS